MHTRDLDGRVLSFGHSGWLWKHAFLLYDTETESLWHHQTGRALSGRLRGKSLQRLPCTHTTFAGWTAEHPETLVLAKPRDPAAPVESDPYAPRNRTITFGVGVEIGAERRLYLLAAVRAAGVAQDEVAGVPLVVAVDPDCRAGHAFDRRVGGATLSFEAGSAADGRPVLRERDGPRSWYLRSGRPVGVAADDAAEGAPEAPRLKTVLSSPWDAAAWRSQHPSGSVWTPRPGSNGASAPR